MPEPIDNQYFKVGHIAKTHGLDGTVVIIPDVNVPQIFETGNLIRLKNQSGDLVPARIEESRLQQKNDRRSFLVKFSHIADKNRARQLQKMPVYISRKKIDEIYDNQSLRRLISYTVQDERNETSGIVEDVLDNPAHPILVAQYDDKELLIPLVDEYLIKIDEEEETVYCQKLNLLADIA